MGHPAATGPQPYDPAPLDIRTAPVPRYGAAALADLLPAVTAPFGLPGARATGLALEPADRVCVFLVDGMGWELLKAHPAEAPFLTSRLAWPLVLCGRNSLEIFGLTILLSVLGSTLMTLAGRTVIVQLAVNLAGILIIFAIGLLMAWYDGGGRLPARPGTEARA